MAQGKGQVHRVPKAVPLVRDSGLSCGALWVSSLSSTVRV